MADSSITSLSLAGNPKTSSFGTLKMLMSNGISVDPGNPVGSNPNPNPSNPSNPTGGGIVIYAQLGGSGNAGQPIGLAVTAGEAPGSVNVQSSGFVSLTTAQWDNTVLSEVGGLTQGAYYYLSSTPGRLTSTPTGVLIGYAVSPTTMLLLIGSAVGGGAEHQTVNAGGTDAATPGVATTFGTTGSGSGTANWTLANGAIDGETKTFHVVTNAEVDAVLTPASFGDGTRITFNNGAFVGSVTLKWDAVTAKWWISSLYLGTVS